MLRLSVASGVKLLLKEQFLRALQMSYMLTQNVQASGRQQDDWIFLAAIDLHACGRRSLELLMIPGRVRNVLESKEAADLRFPFSLHRGRLWEAVLCPLASFSINDRTIPL